MLTRWYHLSPRQILSGISDASSADKIVPLNIVPAASEMNALLEKISSEPIHISIAVLDPLVSSSELEDDEDNEDITLPVDRHGYSSYGRLCLAILYSFMDDRTASKANLWGLKHLISFAIYARDYLALPNSKKCAVLGSGALPSLTEVVEKIQTVQTYLLNTTWGSVETISALQGKGTNAQPQIQFLVELVKTSSQRENQREVRILREVMQHVLDDVDKEDADRWTGYARTLEKSCKHSSCNVTSLSQTD